MKPINLNQFGLQEMTHAECFFTNGGADIFSVKNFSWASLLTDAFYHWDEIKKGFMEGWNIDKS